MNYLENDREKMMAKYPNQQRELDALFKQIALMSQSTQMTVLATMCRYDQEQNYLPHAGPWNRLSVLKSCWKIRRP